MGAVTAQRSGQWTKVVFNWYIGKSTFGKSAPWRLFGRETVEGQQPGKVACEMKCSRDGSMGGREKAPFFDRETDWRLIPRGV
ncbi:hypothetical protein CDL15_Pgr010985 [Punica granatum]|uniref:Uncharacterized protein n=1 Tax=Punica granatum TaxID=22663 RepID=A0A218XNT5_PUNGR|nr:hypothetical protein CDL15_Pgr010985 [Punica granatum]PKI66932.1 hypothetical protein CRG98_012695 [Punica granatum]